MLDDEIAREFLLESLEHLNSLDEALLHIENGNAPDIDGIFRIFHSIKSAVAFLELQQLENIAHQSENILAVVRDKNKELQIDDIGVFFQVGDCLRQGLAAFEKKEDFHPSNLENLLQDLDALNSKINSSEQVVVAKRPVRKSKRKPPPKPENPASESHSLESDSNIRIQISLIDEIINLIGELVVARNQAIRVVEHVAEPEMRPIIHRIDHLTTIIQEKIMTTRMRAIDSAWKRYPRMVRDLSHELGKDISLKMVGQETELDRGLLNMLQEPMRHLLRNCIDHGIESPDERERAGKPRDGTIHLKAFQSTGQVVIEISDDGKGLDEEKILSKAINTQLITEAQATQMDNKQIQQLIFAPGFSTKQAVTHVSGRGVGMDVVHTQLTKAGGQVELDSVFGKGTTVTIRVPLTLAILPALIVQTNEHYFAIPQDNIVEIVDLQDKTGELQQIGDATVYSLRGKLLPVLLFEDILNKEKSPIENGIIIVLDTNELKFGLIIQHVMDTEEVVVKPLGEELQGFQIFSGVTIQGNGQIAWIVDPTAIAQISGLRAGLQEEEILQQNQNITPVLRFHIENYGSAAINIKRIVRIEEIHDQDLKIYGTRCLYTIQKTVVTVYAFGQFDAENLKACNLIICETNTGLIALRVQQVFDIYHEEFEESPSINSLGSMILLDGEPTSLITPESLTEEHL